MKLKIFYEFRDELNIYRAGFISEEKFSADPKLAIFPFSFAEGYFSPPRGISADEASWGREVIGPLVLCAAQNLCAGAAAHTGESLISGWDNAARVVA
jgi:hypothetical protein